MSLIRLEASTDLTGKSTGETGRLHAIYKILEGATLWQGQGHVELTALLVCCEACNAAVAGASKVNHFVHEWGHDDDDNDDDDDDDDDIAD